MRFDCGRHGFVRRVRVDQQRDDSPDLDLGVGLEQQLGDLAGARRLQLGVDLVGAHVCHGLALGDNLAHCHNPAGDFDVLDGASVRDRYFVHLCHEGSFGSWFPVVADGEC